jgi:hypothetical protein
MPELTNEEIYGQLAKALSSPVQFDAFGNIVKIPQGFAGGGRIGANIPLAENEAIRAGLSMSGVHTPNFQELKAQGMDLAYQKGDETYGMRYNRPPPIPMTDPHGRLQAPPPRFMLNYSKRY